MASKTDGYPLSASPDELANLLTRLHRDASTLKDTLGSEYRALKSRDEATAAQTAEEKQHLLESINAYSGTLMQRLGITGSLGPTLDVWLDGSNRQDLRSAWKRCRELLDECRRQNRINGRIIEIQNRNTRRMLEILSGESGHGNLLYDTHGEVQRLQGNRYATQV